MKIFHNFRSSEKGKRFNKRSLSTILAISIVTLVIFTHLASAQLIPNGIRGMVYMSNGTQAPDGTYFSVNDTTSVDFIEGTTGGPPGWSGYYSVSINGEDGDEVIIKAWNLTHYGIAAVSLQGDMTEINVTIDHMNPPPIITITSPQNTTYYTNLIDLNYTLNKPVEWTGYSLDGKPNQSIIPPGSNTTLTNLSEGSHTVTVYANDTTGNIGSSMVMFKICTTPKGDLNHDGNITSADVQIALTIVFSGEYTPEADIDENRCVNILDVRMIMQAAAGNIEL